MTTKPTTETREGTAAFYRGHAALFLAALKDCTREEDAIHELSELLAAAFTRAHALGAASRASPEEGRLREEDKARERLLYGVMWQAREVLSRCNLDGSANLNRKETAALRDAVRDFDREDERLHNAKRSPPEPTTTEDEGARKCRDCRHFAGCVEADSNPKLAPICDDYRPRTPASSKEGER